MCVGCAAAQAPVCGIAGSCATGVWHVLGLSLTLLGVAFATSRLWLFNVTQKVAPFLNKEIKTKKHE